MFAPPILLPALAPVKLAYSRLPHTALTITALMRANSPVVSYDPICLDGLLAYCVVHEATTGAGLGDTHIIYDIPLPLSRLWTSPSGMPLWAATGFTPIGPTVSDVSYWHKRAMPGRH
ncbi:MAG TPA: hypothetical protein VGS58_10640, partial [Candidatus Sulfopaludibacter sp.]|nr:hypothetical protein [Candidatus Sulfopaludibacter sp.]